MSDNEKFHILQVPESSNDYFRFILAVIVVITACIMAVTNQDIPTWLIGTIGSVISFYLGLVSNSRKV